MIQLTKKLFELLPTKYLEEYRNFLENLSFPSFSRLIEPARRTNESMTRTSRPSSTSRPSPMTKPPMQKRAIVAALKKGQEARSSSSRGLLIRIEKHFQSCRHSCAMKKDKALSK